MLQVLVTGHSPPKPQISSMAVISYITAISYRVRSGQHHNIGPDDLGGGWGRNNESLLLTIYSLWSSEYKK